MQGTHSGLALPGTGSQVTGRAWGRWAVTASVTGMLSWVAGVALVPLNARLQERNQHLTQVRRAHRHTTAARLAKASGTAVLMRQSLNCSRARTCDSASGLRFPHAPRE
jgi:multidrug efflux pump subunit AcrB